MFYWFLLLSLHYIIPVPIVESVNVVSDVQHLNDNHPLELHKILIGTENHSSSIDKIDQCEICVIFLDDLKAIINGTAFPAASQMMMERCEDKVGNRIIFEPVCELILRELVRVIQWINSYFHPYSICTKLHICAQ